MTDIQTEAQAAIEDVDRLVRGYTKELEDAIVTGAKDVEKAVRAQLALLGVKTEVKSPAKKDGGGDVGDADSD